jgi:trimethylamine-N-oxide reductase cytochrome c-type subunit TorC
MKKLFRAIVNLFLRPSVRIGLGVLVTGGFIAGVLSGRASTPMEATNKESFCLSCHTMHDNLLPELQKTVHWNNRTGVRARCPDCHVPHDFTDKVARKMQASREVLGADCRHHRHPREVQGAPHRAGAARVEALAGQRLEGMPRLP